MAAEQTQIIDLPIIDLTSPDRVSSAASIRQVTRKRLSTLARLMMSCVISINGLLQIFFRIEDQLWRHTTEKFCKYTCTHGGFPRSAAKKLLSLVALALNLDETFFEDIGALSSPLPFLRLQHYPGPEKFELHVLAVDSDLSCSNEEVISAAAHSDYGMITLLATDGVPGLQVCREKDIHPRVWENVHNIEGALIVNIGDTVERWTNCCFRSTLHRVIQKGKDRYSAAFFFNPPEDLVIECIESCCSESNPPRFPSIRSGDYLRERFRLAYGV